MRIAVVTGAGLMIGVLGIGLTILLYTIGRSQAELELRTFPSVLLAQPGPGLSGRVTVLLDGRKVDGLWLGEFHLANTGDVPIERNDFDLPLVFSTGDTRLEDVLVGQSVPEGIPFQVAMTSGTTFELQPLLLNPDESVAFFTLSETELRCVSAPSRVPIKGIATIKAIK